MASRSAVPWGLSPGARVGKYEILQGLATGGMAELYIARTTGLRGFEKIVVLKRILPQLATNDKFAKMLLAEARIAATLQHVNIAQVFDVGEANGSYFFTMEYVHGEDLRTVMGSLGRTGGTAPLECAIAIVAGVAAGLHHAHERIGNDGAPLALVHRDVSPSNVLVAYDGGVKLVDFGIAKVTSSSADTTTGTLKGKISYMSPEQLSGEPLDRRSDIFALGILLYELTTGKRPFPGRGDLQVWEKVLREDPVPPSDVRTGYPAALQHIVLKALKRSRDERYATAHELALDLEELAQVASLVITPGTLARFMETLFGKQPEPWLAATREDLIASDTQFEAFPPITEPNTTHTVSPAHIDRITKQFDHAGPETKVTSVMAGEIPTVASSAIKVVEDFAATQPAPISQLSKKLASIIVHPQARVWAVAAALLLLALGFVLARSPAVVTTREPADSSALPQGPLVEPLPSPIRPGGARHASTPTLPKATRARRPAEKPIPVTKTGKPGSKSGSKSGSKKDADWDPDSVFPPE